MKEMVVRTRANVRAIAGVDCDGEAWVVVSGGVPVLYTDFRYMPMVRRVAPSLAVRDVRGFGAALKRTWGGAGNAGRVVGFEKAISVAEFEFLAKTLPRARFRDATRALAKRRAVKSPREIEKMRAASRLNVAIWQEASRRFEPGMTEREMAGMIRSQMYSKGDGEAFDTIVCVGPNAAECHHVPGDAVWSGREPVLVDMGVKLDGYCSDMTRNLVPPRVSPLYRKVYDLVLKANRAAIAAVRPGVTGRALDKIARDVIKAGGFGNCFAHSLGHGVGLEIHEAPYASKRSGWTLAPGMFVTIEPGVYLEGNLGVRIEDLVLVTETGCEVLTVV